MELEKRAALCWCANYPNSKPPQCSSANDVGNTGFHLHRSAAAPAISNSARAGQLRSFWRHKLRVVQIELGLSQVRPGSGQLSLGRGEGILPPRPIWIEPAREEGALDRAYLVSRGRVDKQLYAFRRIEKMGGRKFLKGPSPASFSFEILLQRANCRDRVNA